MEIPEDILVTVQIPKEMAEKISRIAKCASLNERTPENQIIAVLNAAVVFIDASLEFVIENGAVLYDQEFMEMELMEAGNIVTDDMHQLPVINAEGGEA